jgi:hypothetical protein
MTIGPEKGPDGQASHCSAVSNTSGWELDSRTYPRARSPRKNQGLPAEFAALYDVKPKPAPAKPRAAQESRSGDGTLDVGHTPSNRLAMAK